MAEETKKTTAVKTATAKTATTKAATTKKASTAKSTTTKASAAKSTVAKTTTAKKTTTTKKAATTVAKEVKVVDGVDRTRLKTKYINEIRPLLLEKFSYSSIMEVPKVVKVVINIGVGDAAKNTKFLDESVEELTAISGQKPVVTKAKKSIASFKVREGMPIGCKVTLRGKRMYQFLDKLITISIPRVRDFRGTSRNAFDGRGNYTLGIKEQLIFPEIKFDQVNVSRGMDIVIVTTAKTDKEALSLLEAFGMPFRK